MGRSHASVAQEYHRSEVVAIASGSMASAEALAASCPAARVYEHYQALLAAPEVDLVCIATPDHLHADVVVAAAQAGKQIIVEKPFTTGVADADRALAAV